jgi:hypothetical protein
MIAPPATSSGWCIPRYMRENATKSGSTIAATQAAMRSLRLGIAEVSSSTSPA